MSQFILPGYLLRNKSSFYLQLKSSFKYLHVNLKIQLQPII